MGKNNLVIIMCDQMTGKVLDNNSDYLMPNLQCLARDGVSCNRAYAPNPICSPSRASLMTGTLPHTHGMVDVTHAVPAYRAEYDYSLDTFSNVINDAGYVAGYFGKWHVERKHILDKFGYDEYITEREIPKSKYTVVDRIVVSNPGTDYPNRAIGGIYAENEDASDEYYLFSKAIDFIERNKKNNFFTFISTNAPHDPYIVPQKYYDMYEDSDLPESFYDDMKDKPAIYRRIRSVLSCFSEKDYKKVRRLYHAYCSLVDDQIGRLIGYLKANDLYDDTLIVFLSDHGDLQAAHGLLCKGVPAFEEGYRIPLLFKMPYSKNRGRICSDLFSEIDIAPTILDILGLEKLRNNIDGISKLSSLNGEKNDYCVIAENFGQRYAYTQRIVWKDNFKYVFNGFDYDEFYDLENDPSELKNQIDNPDYAKHVRTLCRELQEIISRTNDKTMGDAIYYMLRFMPVGPIQKGDSKEFTIYNKEF